MSISEPRELAFSPSADLEWVLVEEGFDLARESELESLLTVANGYIGTRGSRVEDGAFSSPATFIAGVFDVTQQSGSIPEQVILPNWTRLRIRVDGHELQMQNGESLEHRRILDMHLGVLWRQWRHRDPAGRVTSLSFLRLVSLADPHVLLQSVLLVPENYSGQIVVEALMEESNGTEVLAPAARIITIPSALVSPSAQTASVASRVQTFELRTRGTGITIAFATISEFQTEEGQRIAQKASTGEDWLVGRWEADVEIGKAYHLDRLVSVHTSRDSKRSVETAVGHLKRLVGGGVQGIINTHTMAWESRWHSADVEITGDEESQHALRFAVYHLIGAANPEDDRVSIGARALTGEAYKGHVFWDTEIFMLPFYVFTHPPAARALLMYRYHTLPAARGKARSLGYRGALYPWESADTGEETTPPFVLAPDGEVIRILSGEQEHHISADIAYAVWQYWQVSGDDEFFVSAGAEIVLETARFWASRGRIEEDGLYHIRQVIGPDEYHEGVDDNAYTNVMAQWNLERGVETARLFAERWPDRWRVLAERLSVSAEELQEWHTLAEAIYTGFDPRTRLFEQFRGYFDLEEIELAAYKGRTVPMDVLLGRERIQRSKVIKQADVIMLMYLLWDRFPPEVREANFRYYEPRTGHGSSLSPSIHALVAARLNDLELAELYFKQAAEIDLYNNIGNAASGVHAAALGGLWQTAVFGFAGMQMRANSIAFSPYLPKGWQGLRFQVQWQNQKLEVSVGADAATIEVRLEGERAVPVALDSGPEAVINPDHRYLARRSDAVWSLWQEMPI